MQIIGWLWIWELCRLQLAGSSAPYGHELRQPTLGAFQHSRGNCFNPLNIWTPAHTELGRDVDVLKVQPSVAVLPSAQFKWVCESIWHGLPSWLSEILPPGVYISVLHAHFQHTWNAEHMSLYFDRFDVTFSWHGDICSFFPLLCYQSPSVSLSLCHTNAHKHTHTHHFNNIKTSTVALQWVSHAWMLKCSFSNLVKQA